MVGPMWGSESTKGTIGVAWCLSELVNTPTEEHSNRPLLLAETKLFMERSNKSSENASSRKGNPFFLQLFLKG